MGIYSDILLTVDFDRTLTGPDSTIPERNIQAIEYFMANGGAFTVNTGRSLPMYSAHLDRVPVNAPLLLYNGSAAYDRDRGEFLFVNEIDLDWQETVRRCRELFPEKPVEIQGQRHHYLLEHDEKWQAISSHNNCPWAIASYGDDLGPFLKFSLYGELRDVTIAHLYDGTPEEFAEMERMQSVLEAEFGDKCVVFRAAPRIIDVHAKGVSKANAARQLLKALGRSILVCAGDGENDMSMLQAADHAYCPSDAIIRDQFENVCPCAQGAVADVIYKKIPQIIR